jgi:hypothetical protein
VTVTLELEADPEALVMGIDRVEEALRYHFAPYVIIHQCSVSTRNAFADAEEVAMLDQIPHVQELNEPGNIGCICMACVQSRTAKAKPLQDADIDEECR